MQYAQEHDLAWVEDESNLDQSFDRNFVRANLLPVFQQRWPAAAKSVEMASSLLEQESELLKEYLEQDLSLIVTKGFAGLECLDLTKLKQHKRNKQASLTRMFVHKFAGFYPSRNAINELLDKLINSRQDSQPELKLNNQLTLNVHNGYLYVTKSLQLLSEPLEIAANAVTNIAPHRLFSNLTVQSESCSNFVVKFGCLSDKLVPNEGSGSKKVKEILKRHKCPPWYRNEIPLIYYEDQLVAVADLVVDKDFDKQLKIILR